MNQTFKAIFDETAKICGMNHMAEVIKDAIIAATNYAHTRSELSQDVKRELYRTELVDCGSYFTDEGSTLTLPRLRYIKGISYNEEDAKRFDVLGLKQANFRSYNAAYAVYNRGFKLKVLEKADTFELIYVDAPDTNPNTYDSWIATSPYRHAIVFKAVAIVLSVLNSSQYSIWEQRAEQVLNTIGEH